MSDAFIGEVRPFCGAFAPQGWLLCNGQLVDVATYGSLHAIIGFTYGGHGEQFAVPKLSARAAMGVGEGPGVSSRSLGEMSGNAMSEISAAHLPPHTHAMNAAASPGTTSSPDFNTVLAEATRTSGLPRLRDREMYAPAYEIGLQMNTYAVQSSGTMTDKDNHQPSLVCTYIINWDGLYPNKQ